MKALKIIITTLLFISINLFGAEVEWVEKQIYAIKKQRVGLNSNQIKLLSDPVFLKKKVIVKKDTKVKVKKLGKKNEPKFNANKKASTISKTVRKVVSSKRMVLEAIINKSVLINGKWYKLNERVYGYKIVSIDGKSVVLMKYGKKRILSTYKRSKLLKFKN